MKLKSQFTAQALQSQVTTFCGIAAAAGVAYLDWSGEVGDRFVYVSGSYVSFSGNDEKPT